MNNQAAETVARKFLKDLRALMEEANSIVQAADACAESGNIDTAVKIAMDFEHPAMDALEMLKALLLLKREYSVDPD